MGRQNCDPKRYEDVDFPGESYVKEEMDARKIQKTYFEKLFNKAINDNDKDPIEVIKTRGAPDWVVECARRKGWGAGLYDFEGGVKDGEKDDGEKDDGGNDGKDDDGKDDGGGNDDGGESCKDGNLFGDDDDSDSDSP